MPIDIELRSLRPTYSQLFKGAITIIKTLFLLIISISFELFGQEINAIKKLFA